MAPQEMKDVAGQLESGRADLNVVVSSLTEEQARTKPAPDRWSVLECLEHVSLVERRFLGMVRESEDGTLSYDYWTRRFGRDPKVLGKGLRIGKIPYDIVGVSARGFVGTEPEGFGRQAVNQWGEQVSGKCLAPREEHRSKLAAGESRQSHFLQAVNRPGISESRPRV